VFVPRKLLITGVAAVFAVGGAGVATASSLQKEVTLLVDGQTVHVNGYVSTVGDVLTQRSVALQEKDTVQPSAETQVKDGETVRVTRIRAKQVTVAHDGTTSTLTSFSSTVAGALYDAGVTVNVADRVSPEITDPLDDSQTVTIKRVVVSSTQTTAPIAYTSTTLNDATIAKGTQKVTTKGADGVKTSTFKIVTVDGVEESRTLVSQNDAPATNQVTSIGTKTTTVRAATAAPVAVSAAGIDLSNAAMWDKVAKCESGGNWSINTGNGYYGGLQFRTSTWLGAGGGQFAPRADLASREQQITVANRIYATSGLSQWGCKA
jgi:uncharacterized protein YabE (DUF348 family)